MKKSRFYYSQPDIQVRLNAVFDKDGNLLSELTCVGKVIPCPRMTICGSYDDETNTLSFGMAVCSSTDRFEKKVGRKLAETRAIECPVACVEVTIEELPDVFMSSVLQLEEHIFSMKNYKLKA